jgi:hypothetical protein
MLERFEGSPDVEQRHWLVRACVLAPGAVKDPDRLLAAARAAQASPWRPPGTLAALAAAQYRIGRLEEAVARGRELLAAGEAVEKGHQVLAWLVLALAEQQLNRSAAARKWLEQADAELERQRPGAAAEDALPHVQDWGDFLVCRFWQREADMLLKGGQP